ncbi:transposase, MuDR, MULE transposase domain protein [Tanacetum coccineum]
MDLALQFENSYAYEKCNNISQESRALIDTFLKEGSDKDYELNLSMYGKTAKLEKQVDAKLVWLLEKYYYRSQESVGCSSLLTDLYLTEKEIHQLHLDEEALREILEKKAMDEKAHEEKIKQKQAEDDEFFLEFRVKVIEDVGEYDDLKSGAWVSATNYVTATGETVTGCLRDIDNNLKKRKLDQVVAIVKSCSPNALGDLTVTMKDLSAAMILANVSVFTHKPSKHYLNITKRNVFKVFHKDTVPGSGSG